MEPRCQRLFELLAASRSDDPHLHAPVVDDADRRQLVDTEMIDQLGMTFRAHAHELERLVVVAPLQHLREERLDTATRARRLTVEEEEARLVGRRSPQRLGDGGWHLPCSHPARARSNLGLLGGHDEDHALELVQMRAKLGEADLAADGLAAPVVALEPNGLLLGAGQYAADRLP